MNKELEEAINRLKILLKDSCDCEECMKDKKAYITVLNYIENSIPKKAVEEKIEETKLNKNHKYTTGTVVAITNELQKLLEVE